MPCGTWNETSMHRSVTRKGGKEAAPRDGEGL
jgi:hypothetical protein